MASLKKLYLIDKKKYLKSKEDPFDHFYQPEFDILDTYCYGINRRIMIEDLVEKNRLFVHLQRQTNSYSNKKFVICKHVNISFNTRSTWIYCNSQVDPDMHDHAYEKWAVIKDLSQKTYQPMSLQNIAAAKSIKILNNFETCQLFSVFNVVKNKEIFVRAGPNHKRTIYNFANIVKHFIYKKEYEPIVPLEYFEHVKMNPAPFCFNCGLFQKIEMSKCWCNLCEFLRYAGVFTTNIEKPYHTKIIKN